MSGKESTKKLQLAFQTFDQKQHEVRQNLKKLEDTRKEKDAKPIMEKLYEQLRETMDLCEKVGQEMTEYKDDVGKKLGKKEEKKEDRIDSSSSGPEKVTKAQLTPEEQEITYELKAQLMRNVEMQNQKLKTELQLHEKMTEAKALNQQNKRLQSDATMSRSNTLKLMKMFEKKAKDADIKFKEMQQELTKSQQLAKKYQQLYEMERRKMGHGDGSSPQSPTSEGRETPRVPHPNSYSFLGGNVRVNDIIRKNEVLIEENETLKREIQRLKQDNASLLKKAKSAMSDKDSILHRLDTSESGRKELSKRLEKERTSYNLLSKSLQRQASDWILLKKQLSQFDEEYRWSQVGPVNPHSADQRTRIHPVTKNIYMPRKLYPVENYAGANANESAA